MSTPTSHSDIPREGSKQQLASEPGAKREASKRGSSARHGAGLFDIRNIIGLLMALYGIILVVQSFITSAADKAKADGANLNLWTGIGLLVLAAALIGWALMRPIIVDEAELEADKQAVAAEMGKPSAH